MIKQFGLNDVIFIAVFVLFHFVGGVPFLIAIVVSIIFTIFLDQVIKIFKESAEELENDKEE